MGELRSHYLGELGALGGLFDSLTVRSKSEQVDAVRTIGISGLQGLALSFDPANSSGQ